MSAGGGMSTGGGSGRREGGRGAGGRRAAAGSAGGDAGWALRILAEDGGTVRRVPLGAGEHAVGSASGSAVLLTDSGVSRRHARIEVLPDGGAVIEDAGSKNGTFLDGRRIRRAAVAGPALVSFGPVRCRLEPAHDDPLLMHTRPPGPPAAGAPDPESRPLDLGPPPATTTGLAVVDRLAGALREALPPLLRGETGAAETADLLCRRWLGALPVGRVEILRTGSGGKAGGTETLVAAAATGHRAGRDVATLEVTGDGGWRLRLRTPQPEALEPLRPLLEAAVDLLAAGAAGAGRQGAARRTAGSDAGAGSPAAPEPPAPPPGLGRGMRRLYRTAARVARGGVPVLILGESGVGKEVLARWIHDASPRRGRPHLAVNCAAMPRDLLEAELFGIERGVATGVDARAGILERASGGTVLLDEIGDMPAEVQAKVLRVLEGTQLYRVGGKVPVEVDVRFVAATNRDLAAAVEAGSFRRDLYHRLAAFEVEVPPLRRRREEIPALAALFFRRRAAAAGLDSPGITRGALGALVAHPWPGNVRELENEVAAAVLLLGPGEPLAEEHLSARVRGTAGAAAGGDPFDLAEAVRRAEREAFAVALAAAEGEPARAMELLGIARTTWYRKLRELDLAPAAGE